MLSDVIKSDAGTYKCVVEGENNLDGSRVRASGSADVWVGVAPVLSPLISPLILTEGVRYHAVCSVMRGDPPIAISWSRDGQAISRSSRFPAADSIATSASGSSSSSAASEEGGGLHLNDVSITQISPYLSTLTIDSLRSDHRGNYSCTATNRAGSDSVTQQLLVHGACDSSCLESQRLTVVSLSLYLNASAVPPRWRVEPRDAQSTKGKDVVMDCRAHAIPEANVTWFRSRVAGQYHSLHSVAPAASLLPCLPPVTRASSSLFI